MPGHRAGVVRGQEDIRIPGGGGDEIKYKDDQKDKSNQ